MCDICRRTAHPGCAVQLALNFLPAPSLPGPQASTEIFPPQHNPPTTTWPSTAGYFSPISLRTFKTLSTAFWAFPGPALKSANSFCFSGADAC